MEENAASTNSANQDDRIRARRLRIEKRNATRSEKGTAKAHIDPEEEQTGKRKKQVAECLKRIDVKKEQSLREITSVRVEADFTESKRRVQEEEKRQLRLHNLQGEALTSGKKNASVEMRWAELMEHNMPLELAKEMAKQRKACEEIIHSKNRLIAEFQRELKIKDEEYVKALKQQGCDIEELLARMASQYKELRAQYEEELKNIEDAFLQERKELIETNRGEIDALFEKRREMEMNYMDARQEREAAYQKELEELRTRDAEDYNQLKIKLETDIQVLEQQLEEMRATYQLNTEKLEYNYRVLTERDMENSATLAQQKRKLARLKDALSTLMSKYHSSDTKYKQENMELTEEYRRITKQYKDLQSKFRHFELADNKKYREVWMMHQDEIMGDLNKLLAADKILQEQQLGHRWQAPNPDLLICHSGAFSNAQTPPSPQQQNNQHNESQANSTQGDKSAAASGVTGPPSDASDSGSDSQPRSKVFNAKVTTMLEMLSLEADFLIDAKTRNEAEAAKDDGSSAVLRADAILKALNVTNESEIADLLGHFFERIEDDEDDAFALEQAENDEARNRLLGLKVKQDDVVKVARAFIEQRNRENEAGLGPVKRKTKRETTMQAEQEASEARRERDRLEEIEYWSRLANLVPDRTVRVWEALEGAMGKYINVLKNRAESIQEVQSLEAQNEELKALLNQYLGSQVVQDLIVTPMETIMPTTPQPQQQRSSSGSRSPQRRSLYRP
ncbi:Dynein regulatory complex protein 1 [Hondaea fermentalgiana]|uniref:Dynein regulatory complex protein 1 n=1 Tax=Hondaea fermentalgiana TaxID=2315210 RepID=A0A2R5GAA1_9STRA|nr:Dynein regulatory complex protein 1 [Hondaea fermentalgiana]|eukprot:GBG27956.1 Dynein regulatory complex protein 1 [Hondaea fermentalgiana]